MYLAAWKDAKTAVWKVVLKVVTTVARWVAKRAVPMADLTDENLAALSVALMVQRRVGRSDATKAVWKDEITAA